jgi:hypothetical protein
MCPTLRHLAIAFVVSVAGCSGDRTKALVDAYHRAEPPDALFVEVTEAAFLGAPDGWQLLYYDFEWSGAEDSFRGTQKLLIFDEADQYVGCYYLGLSLNLKASKCVAGRATIVLEDGSEHSLEFHGGPPTELEDGNLQYQPAGT